LSDAKCSNRGKVGHTASKCYLKEGKDIRVNQISNKGGTSPDRYKQLVCYSCGLKGHITNECRKPKYFRERKLANQERFEKLISTVGKLRSTDGPFYNRLPRNGEERGFEVAIKY
jgi:hypothetical protein